MAKKDKKGKKGKESSEPTEPDQDELLLATTELEPEQEEFQFTDTSYTSASLESLPPVVEEVVKPKKRRGGKKKSLMTMVSVTEKPSEMNWSEESLPIVEEQKAVEEEPERKKKGKKGKKEKPCVEEIPIFDKPKNWKKMSKKERDLWMEEKIEKWREEKEAEKQAILASAREKRKECARLRDEDMVKQLAEQEIRRDILQKTVNLFSKFEKQKTDLIHRKELQVEWQQYLRCDGLPDPRLVTQMNTYIHLWQLVETSDDAELERRCKEALPLLSMMEVLINNPKAYSKLQLEGFQEVRLAMRAQLGATIEKASYYLLRDLEKHLTYEGIHLATYQREFSGLRLELWVQIRMPTRKPKPVDPEQEPVELGFPAMKVALKLPKILDGSYVCVRAAKSSIDLLSERSRSYPLSREAPGRYIDLFEFNIKEIIDVQALKTQQDATRAAFYKDVKEKVKALEAFLKANAYTKNEKEKEDLDNLNMSEPPFMPDPRTFVAETNEMEFKKYLKSCLPRTRAGEVNLRKYRICGGVLNLDLLITPPQPKRMRNEVTVTTFQLPKALQPMAYQVQYRAPSPPPQGVTRTPEEIEAEMKRTEAEYEKLALVCIDLPQDVMWTEPPLICQWQEPRKLWTTNYVNDYKYNEDKLTAQFRTGVLWPIGIAALRYGNLPFQGWDIRPDPKGNGVLITVTGVAVTVTWLLLGSTVRLKLVANATTPALNEHFNQKYTVKKMIQIMRDAGCDFFPDCDAHNYIEGSCAKEWAGERHNYHAMAAMSRSHNFQWSRWNAEAGWRNIVIQFREAVDKKREAKFQLLYVTPNYATVLRNNEMTQEFTNEPLAGLSFYPDLFTLNMSYGSVDARRTTFNMKYKLVETVFEFLQELKLSSFS